MTLTQTPAGLRRDLEIIDLLARPEHTSRGLGVTRIAELLGREKSQVSRALRNLEAEGMVERDRESLAYRLGWRLYAMAARTVEARLAHLASHYLRRLVAALNETAHLCVLRGTGVLTLLSITPSNAYRALGWEGMTVPAPLTSAGWVLMADWTPDTVRSWTAGWLRETNRPADLLDHLLAQIADVRSRGYAAVDEEFEVGLVGVSAPVRDYRGLIIAAIHVTAPKARLGPHLDDAGERTLAIAQELSAALGYTPH
jgi:DNA-binding IclR family transcriptional regulator|nr:MAG: IclR family transcriptional regulator [Actinomycetota bacterium]